MSRTTIIELSKESFKFSAGHFTIFSKTERENLHGHNFNVSVSFVAEVSENGICFDYGIFKSKITSICQELNETFILPTNSPFLSIETTDDSYYAIFNGEVIPFLKRDVTLLPISNTTVEEFARYILEKIVSNKNEFEKYQILEMIVKVSSVHGQSGAYTWKKQQNIEILNNILSTIKDV